MEKLYKNIGKKIKILAFCSFIVEAITSILVGIDAIGRPYEYGGSEAVGILILLLGPVVAWVGSWLLYGFGELVEHTQYIAANTYALAKNPDNKA